MKNLFVFIILGALNHNIVLAQNTKTQLKIITINADSTALPDVDILIQQGGHLIQNRTDKRGEITVNIISGASFILKLSHIGYKSQELGFDSVFARSLLKLVLVPDIKELKAVDVKAFVPFIKVDRDKIIISIDKDKVAGQSVADILKSAPGITIQNNIILFEGRPVSAQMNGKNIPLSASTLTDYLTSTSASSLKEVEIITVPQSKIDAGVTGAMVNLKPAILTANGYTGNINMKLGTRSNFGNGGAGASVNFRYTHLTGILSLNYSKDNQVSNGDIDRNFIPNTSNRTALIKEHNNGKYAPENTPLLLSLQYQIDHKNSIGVFLNGMFSDSHTDLNSSSDILINSGDKTQPDSIKTMNSTQKKRSRIGSYDVYYKLKIDSLGQELNFDAAYSTINATNNNSQQYNYLLPDVIANKMPSSLLQYSSSDLKTTSLQVDYSKPVGKLKFESGLKSGWTSVSQNLDQNILAENSSSHLVDDILYNENILAGYADLGGDIGQWHFFAGLRGENTTLSSSIDTLRSILNRSYFNLFPTLLLSKKIGKSNITISYRKSIERPRFNKLTNFQYYTSPFYYFTGNPALQPYLQHNFRLTWALNNKFEVTASYIYNKNNLLEYSELDTTDNITKGLIANNGDFKTFNFSQNYFSNLTKWWYTNTEFRINRKELNFVTDNEPTNLKNWGYSFSSSNTITINESLKCELYAYYNSPTYYNAAKTESYWFIDLSIFKNILRGMGQLSFSVSDIFYTNISRSTANYGLVSYSLTNRWDSRNFVLGFNYRFGNKNFKSSQLRRNSGNDDIRKRSY